ncbi:MAG: hypothetical protein WC663_05220 [Patescibacteria group bacterium]|jgi:hypothetical protein
MSEGEPQLSQSEIKGSTKGKSITKEGEKMSSEELYLEVNGLLQASADELRSINQKRQGMLDRIKELEPMIEECIEVLREKHEGEYFEYVSLKRDLKELYTQKEVIFELQRQFDKFADHLAKLVYDIKKRETN